MVWVVVVGVDRRGDAVGAGVVGRRSYVVIFARLVGGLVRWVAGCRVVDSRIDGRVIRMLMDV